MRSDSGGNISLPGCRVRLAGLSASSVVSCHEQRGKPTSVKRELSSSSPRWRRASSSHNGVTGIVRGLCDYRDCNSRGSENEEAGFWSVLLDNHDSLGTVHTALMEGGNDADGEKGGSETNGTIVLVRASNMEVLADEQSRLQTALASQDRPTIRSIMHERRLRAAAPSVSVKGASSSGCNKINDNGDHVSGSSDLFFYKEDFSCPICRNILYKPCVNTCGHAFCFWCLKGALNEWGVGTSRCPMCRNPITQFAAVFAPMHRFLRREFPKEIEGREIDTIEEERGTRGQSPNVPEAGSVSASARVGSVDVSDLLCVRCSNVVNEPVVPVCGHLVCKGCVQRDTCASTVDAEVQSLIVGVEEDGGEQSRLHFASCPECRTPIMDGVGEQHSDLNVCSVLEPLLARIERMDKEDVRSIEDAVRNARETNMRTARLREQSTEAKGGVVDAPISRNPSKLDDTTIDFVHFGLCCDGCGLYPVVGHAYHCRDCPEAIGFDLCHDCCSRGVHLTSTTGRFNQTHEAWHQMQEMKQVRNVLHDLMDAHPELTPSQIMRLVEMQNETADDV